MFLPDNHSSGYDNLLHKFYRVNCCYNCVSTLLKIIFIVNFHDFQQTGDNRNYVEMTIINSNNLILNIAFTCVYICTVQDYSQVMYLFRFHTYIAFTLYIFQTTKAVDRQRVLEDIQLDLLVIFLSKY